MDVSIFVLIKKSIVSPPFFVWLYKWHVLIGCLSANQNTETPCGLLGI